MSSLLRGNRLLAGLGLMGALVSQAAAQTTFGPQGGEYGIVGSLPGDQVYAQTAINTSGGYIVWHDNVTDGDGLGIGARRLNSNLSGALDTFRVNKTTAGDQMLPQVSMLKNGGAVFVWQGGQRGLSKIYARFMAPDGTFVTDDVQVSDFSGRYQTQPMLATLENGDVVIAWSSYGQERTWDGKPVPDGHHGVYARRFSAQGRAVGSEFQVNTETKYNQRTPSVAALSNGSFLIAWVSESPKYSANNLEPSTGRTDYSDGGVTVYDVSIYGQRFAADGARTGGEIKINKGAVICANPHVAGNAQGFSVVWAGKPRDPAVRTARPRWQVYGRAFSFDGTPRSDDVKINEVASPAQHSPKVSSINSEQFVIWTSFGTDGSRETISSRLVSLTGQLLTEEHRVNTTTIGQQMFPSLGTDGASRYLVVWSSFVGGRNSYDLFAQRFSTSQALAKPAPPYVAALSQSRLSVTWPKLAGYEGVTYELYVNGAAEPLALTDNRYNLSSLLPNSSHTFRLAYKLANGQRSPLSDTATGSTWGEDENFDGLPDDWQITYWGVKQSNWGAAGADSDGDGASNLAEFLAGTNPADPASVLKVRVERNRGALWVRWNAEPGSIYQLQASPDLQSWSDSGSARFAAERTDALSVQNKGNVEMYRVIKLR